MSLISSNCIEFIDNRSICTARQNGKTYTLNNQAKHTIRKVKIDGCVFQAIGEHRCDYLMSLHTQGYLRVFFIELKGGKLLDAVEQIYDTVLYLKNEFVGYKLNARIVSSRGVPKLKSDPKYKRLAKEIISTNGSIEIATNKSYIETI